VQVSLKYAEEHLADLLSAAHRGESIEIAVPDRSPIKLVVSADDRPARRPRRELLGAWEGLMILPSDEEWAVMDRDIEEEMLDGAVSSREKH
jgi:antitoxin (DNA-binding transcriptional repressor) of toxin-antitoxin stability system